MRQRLISFKRKVLQSITVTMKNLFCVGIGVFSLLCVGYILSGCSKSFQPKIDYPYLRVLSTKDIDLIKKTHATFTILYPMSFGRGEPWRSYTTRSEFNEYLEKTREFTDSAHKDGITVISYITKTFSSDFPELESLAVNKAYNTTLWNVYEDYFGPKPPESPTSWIERKADSSLGGYVWYAPSGGPGDYEKFLCANNPYFHRYMKGVIKILCDMGIDGFYLDHSESEGCYCYYCQEAFRQYLNREYPIGYVTERYGISSIENVKPPVEPDEALWSEWKKFTAKSQANLHNILLKYGHEYNPHFIVAGNLFGAGGFANAIFNGSDIEMMGEVDVILYSEIVPSTVSLTRGQLTIPGYREDSRVSNSPLYKHMVAAHHEKPILVYPLYPESPNPIPKESALYNIVRLVTAEAAANHVSMRRIQERHSSHVIHAVRDIYNLLEKNEEALSGAKMYSNVAILTSLNQFYYGNYSYIYSASRVLNDEGISHVMITEKELTSQKLSPYEVLILPFTPLMSNEQEKIIEDFINRGGGVVVIGPSGIKNQFGEIKIESTLASLIGIDYSNPPREVIKKEIGSGRIIYLWLDLERERMDREIFNDYDIAIMHHKIFGWGQFPDALKVTFQQLINATRWAANDSLTEIVESPGTVELTSMKSPDGKRIFAHLVNYQIDIDGNLTPLKDINVSIQLPKGKSVKLVLISTTSSPEAKELDFIEKSGNGRNYVKFSVPELEIYNMAHILLK